MISSDHAVVDAVDLNPMISPEMAQALPLTSGDVIQGPMTQRRVAGLALPIMGENLLHTSVVAIDTFMVSKLGSDELAGVGTAAEMVFLIIAMLVALDIGATVLVSQAIGAGNRAVANGLSRQALIWGVLVAIPISIFGYMAVNTVVGLFGLEPDVAKHAATYMHITTGTIVFLLLTLVSGAVLRGAGDSRTPLYAAIAANATNIIVAYLLIFGHLGLPELGVAGSAWGAAAARGTSALVLVLILVSGRKAISIRGRGGWMPSVSAGRQIFKLGIPAAIQEMLVSLGFLTMLAVVALLGTAALAAQQIAFTALSLAFMPGFAFGIASTALVGQSIGAQKPDDARRAVHIAARWSVIWMAAGGLLYVLLAPQLMNIFTDDPLVASTGSDGLRALAIGLPFWGIWFVFGGALRGSGDTRTPMITSTLGVWSAVGLAYIVVSVFDRGLGAVWLTFFITAPMAALANWFWFRRRLAHGVKAQDLGPIVTAH